MVTEYRAFSPTPGQKAPTGSTGVTLSGTDEIVWEGEEGTFNENAEFGTILPTDTTPESTVTNRVMTQEEIDEYLNY